MHIWCDGGCIGNGTKNPKCYGSFKVGRNNPPITFQFPELTTNNQAEYQILIIVLELIDPNIKEEVIINVDSALVFNQVTNGWKTTSNRLRELNQKAQKLYNAHPKITLNQISGDEMKRILGH